MLYLLGLTDDYQSDGHVITQALTSVPSAARGDGGPRSGLRPDQLERRPVRDRHADRRLEGARVRLERERLCLHDRAADAAQLADDRDAAATTIKQTLTDAAAGKKPNNRDVADALAQANGLLDRAATLAGL